MQRTNFKPKWCGANSTALTVPFASDNTALSTQREFTEPDCCCCCCCCCWEEPFGWLVWEASDCPLEACSQILTVRSKDEEAMMDPNSGCAQAILDMAASWAYIYVCVLDQVKIIICIDWLSEMRDDQTFQSSSTCQELLSSTCQTLILKRGWTRRQSGIIIVHIPLI